MQHACVARLTSECAFSNKYTQSMWPFTAACMSGVSPAPVICNAMVMPRVVHRVHVGVHRCVACAGASRSPPVGEPAVRDAMHNKAYRYATRHARCHSCQRHSLVRCRCPLPLPIGPPAEGPAVRSKRKKRWKETQTCPFCFDD